MMKKTIYTSVILFMAFILFAQEMEPEGVAGDVSIHSMVPMQGPFNMFIWGMIVGLSVICLILGITAIIASHKTKILQTPLSVKLLPCGTALLFILGFMGVVDTASSLLYSQATMAGEAKKAFINLTLSEAFQIPAFALLGGFFYMLFLIIALIVLHFRHKKIIKNNSGLMHSQDSVPPP